MSFPPGTEMFQFPGFALESLCVQQSSTCKYPRCATAPRAARTHPRARPKPRTGTIPRRSKTGRTTRTLQVGFPIRKSADQSLFSAPHGLSQSTTSFIASYRQGIHQTPLLRLIRSRRRKTALLAAHRSARWTAAAAAPARRERRRRTLRAVSGAFCVPRPSAARPPHGCRSSDPQQRIAAPRQGARPTRSVSVSEPDRAAPAPGGTGRDRPGLLSLHDVKARGAANRPKGPNEYARDAAGPAPPGTWWSLPGSNR